MKKVIEWLLPCVVFPFKILKLDKFMKKAIEWLWFPFKILTQDKFLSLWILTSLVAGFLPDIFSFLTGYNIGTENYYIFSMTMLIPSLSDSFTYLYKACKELTKDKSEDKGIDDDEKSKVLPFLGERTAMLHVLILSAISCIAMAVMLMLYSGQYKDIKSLQYLFVLFSVYLAFYYRCIDSIVQHPDSYSEVEEQEIEAMSEQSKSATSVETNGKEVAL